MKKAQTLHRLILAIIIFVVAGGGITYFCLTSAIPTFKEQTYELGDVDISNNIEDYLKCSSYVRTRATLDTSKVDTQKVGDYIVSCHALKKDFDFIIHIVDTTEPEVVFNDVVFGTYNEYKVDEIASANDLSDIVRFEIIDSNNDTGTFFVEEPGKYTISLVAEDEYGNTATADKEIAVVESPHFILLNDRKYKVSNGISLLDFVYAEDKDGNDISKDITIVNDGGYNTNETGIYDVTYSVIDKDNIQRIQSISIEIGEFDNNDFGYEREEFLSTIIDHDYFSYTPLENNEDLDVVAELTSPTSFSIKGKTEIRKTMASAFLYEVTNNHVYFITNKHCAAIFRDFDAIKLYDYQDNIISIPNSKINTYKSANKDLLCFAIPIEYFNIDMLIHYKKVTIDKLEYENLQVGDSIFVNTQAYGRIDGQIKDIVKATTIRSLDEAETRGIRNAYPYMTENKGTVQSGQSGSPVFNFDGHLVAIVTQSNVSTGEPNIDLFTQLPDLLEFMENVEIK